MDTHRTFIGKISDLQLFGRVLSANEISALAADRQLASKPSADSDAIGGPNSAAPISAEKTPNPGGHVMRTYETEFPGFELGVEIPEHWEDCSWHNDTCPCWFVGPFRVFVDYADPDRREVEGMERFQVIDHAKQESVLETSDWQAVLDCVEPRYQEKLAAFRATRKWSDNLEEVVSFHSDEAVPGYYYLDALYIEQLPNKVFHLLIIRDEHLSDNVEELEPILFQWACSECYEF